MDPSKLIRPNKHRFFEFSDDETAIECVIEGEWVSAVAEPACQILKTAG